MNETMNDTAALLVSHEALPFPLQDTEQVLRVCRRHWIYFWPNMALQAFIMLVPPIVLGLLLSEAGAYEDIGAKVFWAVAGLWFLYWGVRVFLAWYRYRHDIWVITNQRLIDVFKPHPFSLKLSTADLVNVQDMTVDRQGLLRTLLDCGDIICQTAAENQDFLLPGIPHPRDVQALVDRERDRERLRVR